MNPIILLLFAIALRISLAQDTDVTEGIQHLSTQNCGVFGDLKVIYGREVALMGRPWMVYLNISYNSEEFFCGGTLISNRFVLTAAHCLLNRTLSSVRLGEHTLEVDPDCKYMRGRDVCSYIEEVEHDRVFIHEEYSRVTKHNDIALVRLSKEVEFKANIRPICLPLNETLQQIPETLEQFFVTGWGETETYYQSNALKEATILNFNRVSCHLNLAREIISSQLCALAFREDSCAGDSGGPLSYVTNKYNGSQRFVQFGIVSYGPKKCGNGRPGVYTNVGSYIRWIAQKIATK